MSHHSDQRNEQSRTAPAYSRLFALILAILVLYRLVILAASDLTLYFDEAYYWFWSNFPAFGYYSKPPMIAWVIASATAVCGDGEACIRSGSALLFGLSSFLVFGLGVRMFDRRVGFWAGVIFTTLPLVSFYSQVMTTDALLLFFWVLSLYGIVRALDGNRWADWLLTGAALGGGLLSKYTMSFFVLSSAIYLSWSPSRRSIWRNPRLWVAAFLAAAMFAPNLVWNELHSFASFRHTAEIAKWSENWLHPDKFLEFVGGQFLLFGPALALATLYWSWRIKRSIVVDDRFRLIIAFTFPILGLYAIQALVARANLNWAAAAYVAGSLLAAAVLTEQRLIRTLAAALIVNGMIGIAIYHYVDIANALGITLTRQTDVYKEMRGWDLVANRVRSVMNEHPKAGLLCDNRKVMSELIYYLRPHPFDAAIYNPSGVINDHFRLTADVSRSPLESFIFVTQNTDPQALRGSFDEVQDLGIAEVTIHDGYALKYQLFLVKRFRGYGL